LPRIIVNGRAVEPELVLFDVDGTLVDDGDRYSSLGRLRFQAMREAWGEEVAREWARLTGVEPQGWRVDPGGPICKATRAEDLALAAGVLYRWGGMPWHQAKSLAVEAYQLADRQQEEGYTPRLLEGVGEKLQELSGAGFKLGVATNGETVLTRRLLEQLGVASLFSVVTGADKAGRGKPAPDVVVWACREAGVDPGRCVYVGDQPTDEAAAASAGVLLFVGVGCAGCAGGGAVELVDSLGSLVVEA